MEQFNRLSNREREVLQHLLQGKSNKQMAASLHISVRTVEFHLKNMYAKFEVSTRVELILKLGNTTGTGQIENLGPSTVDGRGKIAENRDRFHSQVDRSPSFRDTASILGKEFEMKSLLRSRHVHGAVVTALFTGLLWVSTLLYSHSVSLNDLRVWGGPLLLILAMIGSFVGLVAKRTGSTLRRACFSALFGTGLSPFLILPLMFIVVLPLGKLAERFGFMDPSTMPGNVANILAAAAMLTIWLIVGIAIGVTSLFLSLRKPGQASVEGV